MTVVDVRTLIATVLGEVDATAELAECVAQLDRRGYQVQFRVAGALTRPRHLPSPRIARELKEVARRYRSQPVAALIAEINPKLQGWVNYFRIGHAGQCFAIVRRWVERKVRRHLMRARNRRASAGRGGVRRGSMTNSGCLPSTECGT